MKSGGASWGSPTVMTTAEPPCGKDCGVTSWISCASRAKDDSGTSAKRPENTRDPDASTQTLRSQITCVSRFCHPGKKKRAPGGALCQGLLGFCSAVHGFAVQVDVEAFDF